MELEALEAIYADDFVRLDEGGGGAPSFELTLVPETGGDNNHVSVCVHVVYAPTYPEAPPEISVRNVRGLIDTQVDECAAMLRAAAAGDELLGTAMVYSLAEMAQSWMAERNVPEDRDMHAEMMERLAVEQQAAAADGGDGGDDGGDDDGGAARGGRKKGDPEGSWRSDGRRQVADGAYTPVTPESFSAWRAAFDAEVAAATVADQKKAGTDGRLTGRQLFERDGKGALILDDAGALQEDEEDAMVGEREPEPLDDEAEAVAEGEAMEGDGALLAEVGDDALFDDEDLPDDV